MDIDQQNLANAAGAAVTRHGIITLLNLGDDNGTTSSNANRGSSW